MSVEKLIEQPIQQEAEKNQKPIFSFEEPEYLKEHPIISRETLTTGDHSIEFINQNPNVQLDEKHLSQARKVLERIYSIAPELVKNYKKIFLVYDPGLEKRLEDDPYAFAPNAQNIQSIERMQKYSNINDGIFINKRGFRTDLPHRIKKANNFEGTLTHEIAHAVKWVEEYKYKNDGAKGILYKFQEELGYHPIFRTDKWIEVEGSGRIGKKHYMAPIEGWKMVRNETGGLKGYLHEATGYFTSEGYAPENLKSVPTRYAQLKPEEDFCDSFVAYLFDPDKLDDERREFFEKYFPLKTSKENGK